jgi:chloramphenicol 3-O-phosphotransferase
MLIVLVGPKGSGKSHIGRLLEAERGVHFFHVEPLWMAYHAACRANGRAPSLAEGIGHVHPALAAAVERHRHVCVETTGASREILGDLLRRAGPARPLLVNVRAPLQLCLDRIASRDQTHQIPLDAASIRHVDALSRALDLPFDLVIDNVALSPEAILQPFARLLQT